VETADQLELVIALGFDTAQGYLLNRPGPLLDAGPVDLAKLIGVQFPSPARLSLATGS
jgi:EAL domain-containing protein (putative c-di-GMP-specific phosphodiesterase class I)